MYVYDNWWPSRPERVFGMPWCWDASSCELSNVGLRYQTPVFSKNKLLTAKLSLHAPQQLLWGAVKGEGVFWRYYLSYILLIVKIEFTILQWLLCSTVIEFGMVKTKQYNKTVRKPHQNGSKHCRFGNQYGDSSRPHEATEWNHLSSACQQQGLIKPKI